MSGKRGRGGKGKFAARAKQSTKTLKGAKGILFTVDEKKYGLAKKEIHVLLSEYIDEFYNVSNEEEAEAQDIDKALEAEVAGLKKGKKSLFRVVDLPCNGVAFAECSEQVDVVDAVHRIMSDLKATRQIKTQCVFRMVPATTSCYSAAEDIAKTIEGAVAPFFAQFKSTQFKRYCVVFNSRSNSTINRKECLDMTTKHVPYYHIVDLSNPDVAIFVQPVTNVVFVGICDKYSELGMFHLHAFHEGAEPKQPKQQKKRGLPADATAATATETAGDDAPEAKKQKVERVELDLDGEEEQSHESGDNQNSGNAEEQQHNEEEEDGLGQISLF